MKGLELKSFLHCLKERIYLEELYLRNNEFEFQFKNYERYFIADLLKLEFFWKLNDVPIKNKNEEDGELIEENFALKI